MSSWGAITLDMMPEDEVEVSKKVPMGLQMDSGVDEQGWLEEGERYYAVSFGRHQHLRFMEYAREFHSPWYNGVRRVAVVDANNTGDNATVHVFKPPQEDAVERVDGHVKCDEFSGDRRREADREAVKDRVEDEHGFRPRIEPVDELVPPDAVVHRRVDE